MSKKQMPPMQGKPMNSTYLKKRGKESAIMAKTLIPSTPPRLNTYQEKLSSMANTITTVLTLRMAQRRAVT